MNWQTIWDIMRIALGIGTVMEGLPVGSTAHSTDVGVPPAWVTWRDGRRFAISLHVQRIS